MHRRVARFWVSYGAVKTLLKNHFGPVIVVLVLLSTSSFYAIQQILDMRAQAAPPDMILLWDGTDHLGSSISVPADWTVVTTYDGKFPRGEEPANFGTTGGGGAHTPTQASFTITPNDGAQPKQASPGNPIKGAPTGHTHTASGSVSLSAASNNDEPAYRSLMIIQYDFGIPATIPAGAMAYFDDNPGMPSGWTRESAQDAQFVKVNSSVSTGGSDTHNHTITWPSLNAASGTVDTISTGNTIALQGHTHAAPSNSNTSDTCSSTGCLPPYIVPILAKANSSTGIPPGLIAMFNADPGTGWDIRSDTGDVFYQKFVRPNVSFNGTPQGSASHTHANATATTGTSSSSTGTFFTGTAVADGHAHQVTASFNSAENMPEYFNVVYAEKSTPTVHMLLFWDGGGSPPTGWSYVTAAEGRYLRGDAPENYGVTGGNTTHTHDNTSNVTMSAPSAEVSGILNSSNPGSITAHTHTFGSTNVTTTASNEPAGYQLRLIRYDSGVPNVIPNGAIAIFDGDPGMPTDGHWTQLGAANSRVIKVASSVGNGPGSDTHTHTLTWSSLANTASGTANTCFAFGIGCNSTNRPATTTHNHAAPSSGASATATGIPPYFQPVLGKVDQDTPTISLGLTAMFDGNPGGGWVIRSGVGGDYHHKFIRPSTTYSVGSTVAGHKIPNTTGVTGAAASTGVNGNAGGGVAMAGHTHTMTAIWPDYTSDSHYISNNEYFLPQYFSIVIAEKVNFILSKYAWYDDDNNLLTPVTKWGNPDIADSSPIVTLPTAAADPPDLARRLRLRIQILINGNNLAVSSAQFRLQYSATRSNSCTTTFANWQDVGPSAGSSAWRFATSTVSNGTTLWTTPNNSVFSPQSTVAQTYTKSNPTVLNPNAATIGNTVEYDFHIQHHAAAGATQYSFRIIEDNGTLLSEYTVCPVLTTKPQTENLLRHGGFFNPDPSGDATGNLENGFSWVD